jgi:aryl-alcohol dehydrogenase-like predicted oxidoreductase
VRYVELYPGIASSVLGFGCAPILGSIDGPTARRAIAIALEEGVTHFDVARSYGYGFAERFLGQCVHERRSEVVIASKFGMVATPAARIFHTFKPMVRFIRNKKRRASLLNNETSRPRSSAPGISLGNIFLKRVHLECAAMKRSVETSLRELKTDYLDYLFLHEPMEPISDVESLISGAYQLKKDGKIRALGLAFRQEQVGWHIKYLSQFDLLQMDNCPLAANYGDLKAQRHALPTIFYSPFRSLIAAPRLISMSTREILSQMHEDFPQSVVLVSMFREDHIRENARYL